MKKRPVGTLATIVVALLFGVFGLLIAFLVGMPVLVSYIPSMHGAALSIPGGDTSNFGFLNGLQSCCICIPIPLALGFFALHQQAKEHVTEDLPSQPSSDL